MAGLTDKRQRFVEEYPVDLNATQAAIRAGYSEKTARQIGANLLSKVYIQTAIQDALAKRSKRTEITTDMVLKELALLGFANMKDYIKISADGDPFIDLSDLTREQAAAISETMVEDYYEGRGEDARQVRKVKIKFHDKKGALVDIGKHLGMFVDKSEVDVTLRGPLVIMRSKKDKEVEMSEKGPIEEAMEESISRSDDPASLHG